MRLGLRFLAVTSTLLCLWWAWIVPALVGHPLEVSPWKQVKPRVKQRRPLIYGHSWGYYDHMLKPAASLAGHVFGVRVNWLQSCNHAEGGDVGRELLRVTIHRPRGPGDGWNRSGSRAFGPWQYMMDRKPAPNPSDWGTFERYMGVAFDDAHRRGLPVPVRYRRPDSYLGQAIVTAFMFRIGQSGQWEGAGC